VSHVTVVVPIGGTSLSFGANGVPTCVKAGWNVFAGTGNNPNAINPGTTVVGTPNYSAGTLTISSGVPSFANPMQVGEPVVFTNGGGGAFKTLLRWSVVDQYGHYGWCVSG
jgi:hypothetical protein